MESPLSLLSLQWPHHMTSSNPNFLPKSPPPNAINVRIWGFSFQHMNFWGVHTNYNSSECRFVPFSCASWSAGRKEWEHCASQEDPGPLVINLGNPQPRAPQWAKAIVPSGLRLGSRIPEQMPVTAAVDTKRKGSAEEVPRWIYLAVFTIGRDLVLSLKCLLISTHWAHKRPEWPRNSLLINNRTLTVCLLSTRVVW
jgi:hypothetical protein